jgi:N-acetyl-anhydromuramyl-L-alanine amidase AmpD
VIMHIVKNYSMKPPGCKPVGVVIHCTTGGPDWDAALRATLEWFDNPNSSASAHIVIRRNGDIYKCVLDENNAWHAGICDLPHPGWLPDGNPNNWTLGVELVGTPDNYTDAQFETVVRWIRDRAEAWDFPLTNICAHSDLYSQRSDPGQQAMQRIRGMLA